MSEILLKSLQFPGSDDTYKIPSTVADIGAAPSGYVVTDYNATTVDAVKNAILTEFNKLTNHQISFCQINVDNLDTTYMSHGNWQVVVKRENDGYGSVELQSNASMMVAGISKGVVSDLMWVNPPMAMGAEYRTTECYNGKPVYVKTFSASFNSTSAAGTVKDLLIPHGLPNHYIVRVEATAGTYMFPSIMDRDSFTSIYTIDATNITIRICDDNWSGSIRFTLYYTKD